jgi:hypothetical protein
MVHTLTQPLILPVANFYSMTSKNIRTNDGRTTMDRLRRYGTYVRAQPTTGWSSPGAENGRLELTAIAGATV